MGNEASKTTSGLEPPVDLSNLVFLPEGEGTLDLSTLPPVGTPVVASHTIDIPISTERALQAEAAELGISVEAVIVARLSRSSAA